MDVLLGIVLLINALLIRGVLQDRKQRHTGNVAQPPQIDEDALLQVKPILDTGRKIEAIKVYRQLTNVGLKQAKDAIDYFEAHPEMLNEKKKSPQLRLQDSGIRDLIEADQIDEAAEVYQKFAGVDEYTARDAVEQIKRNLT